jgi:hypothetical protein
MQDNDRSAIINRSSAPPDGDRVNYRNVYQTAITTN